MIAQPPENLCGYEVVAWLKTGRTALCRADNARLVVLKELDKDCLLGGALNPAVYDRLAFIRELPHAQVATLIGVEKDPAGRVFMVWQYVEGTDFETYACDPARASRQVHVMLRELILALESLHGQGVVHGDLRANNILIDSCGEIHLLDVSPLLHNDERIDIEAVGELIGRVLECRGEEQTPLGQSLLDHIARRRPLSDLSAVISRSMDSGTGQPPLSLARDSADVARRRRTFWWALLCGVGALILAGVTAWLVQAGKYSPPDAPADAMKARER